MLWYHLLPLVTASLKGCSDGITCRTVNASGLSFDCRFAVPTTTPATNTTVMLLHGFPEWSVMYVNLMRTLSSHGYSSVACNQRGYSPGAAPAGVTNYNGVFEVLNKARPRKGVVDNKVNVFTTPDEHRRASLIPISELSAVVFVP